MKILPKLMLSLQGIEFGEHCVFKGLPIIAKEKQACIKIGNRVRIRSSIFSNLIGLYQRTIIVAKGKAVIDIGDDVGMSGVTIYARELIKIGRKCLIGANTKIMDNDFHPVDPELRLKAPNQNVGVHQVTIGENVFIGCNSIILKGTTIGENTTIGAGSVVSGNIPANCVAAGNPAKVIKQL